MHNIKNVIGFEFVEVGEFYINEKPLNVTYDGKPDIVSVSLKLVNDEIKKVGESAYLVYVDDELAYVGEYLYNLENRWIKRKIIFGITKMKMY